MLTVLSLPSQIVSGIQEKLSKQDKILILMEFLS